MKLGFIGSGNMAQAMIKGMLKAEVVTPTEVIISAPSQATRDTMSRLGLHVTPNNQEVAQADIVFLTVKPYLYQSVIEEICSSISAETIIVTVAPGISFSQLAVWFGKEVKVVRTMPNTPAMVSAGVTGCCANEFVTEEEFSAIERLLNSFGTSLRVAEKLMEAVGGLSGSGPAYVYMVIEAMSQAGIQAGLPANIALELTAQTVLGAAKMIQETGLHPATLRDQVCSPGGSTIEGVRVLEKHGVRSGIMEAVIAGIDRAKDLGKA